MKLVVPLDGSAISEAAAPVASTLARASGMNVTLVTVIDPSHLHATWGRPPEPGLPGVASPFGAPGPVMPVELRPGELIENMVQAGERARNEARDYLERVGNKYFQGAAGMDILVGDDVAGELLSYIRSNHVDLIAMATHGRTGLARIVLGSVANRLVTSGVAPILLVRPKDLNPARP